MNVKFGSGKFHGAWAKDAKWKAGLRKYMRYRDLGMVKASKGAVQAHVIRAVKPSPGRSGWHRHDVAFQMNYVIQGWIRSQFEGQGIVEFGPGDAWYQPPNIKHEVLDFSDDFTVLEINVPADFVTAGVTPPKGKSAPGRRAKGRTRNR